MVNKRAEIIVIVREKDQRFVFDPKIRWKTNISTQDEDINA